MKSIALIVDVPDWAFDLQAHFVKKGLEGIFNVDIFYSKQEPFNEDLVKILEKVKDYDIIHFFWRKTLLPVCDEGIRKSLEEKGINVDKLKQKLSTGIYDHLFIGDDEYNPLFNEYVKKYVTSSKKLFDIYVNNSNIKNPCAILGDTFDDKMFKPTNMQRFDDINKEKLIIGWVGNSSWNNKLKDENDKPIDFKGYQTILKPAVEELNNEGYKIEIYLADKNINFIPNDKMGEYYNTIDVYVCTSITEGTPRPLIESMGCGVPVITTDVGVAREFFGEKQLEFILDERQIGVSDDKIKEELKEKIKYLYNNRSVLKELAEENYANSKRVCGKEYIEKFKQYFLNF